MSKYLKVCRTKAHSDLREELHGKETARAKALRGKCAWHVGQTAKETNTREHSLGDSVKNKQWFTVIVK